MTDDDVVLEGFTYGILVLREGQSGAFTPTITSGKRFLYAPDTVLKVVEMYCTYAEGSLASMENLLKHGSLVIEREDGEVLFDGLVRKVPTATMWHEAPGTVAHYRFAEPFDVSKDDGVRFRLCLHKPSPGPVMLRVILRGVLA